MYVCVCVWWICELDLGLTETETKRERERERERERRTHTYTLLVWSICPNSSKKWKSGAVTLLAAKNGRRGENASCLLRCSSNLARIPVLTLLRYSGAESAVAE